MILRAYLRRVWRAAPSPDLSLSHHLLEVEKDTRFFLKLKQPDKDHTKKSCVKNQLYTIKNGAANYFTYHQLQARETDKTTFDFAFETIERGISARYAVCHQYTPNIKAVRWMDSGRNT